MKIRIMLLGLLFHWIAVLAQRAPEALGESKGNSTKWIETVFVSYENGIAVDSSRYALSIADYRDSLKFEYYTTLDSSIATSVTVSARDSLPINVKAKMVDTIQFEFNSDIEQVYKYEVLKDTIYGVRSGFLWHKEYGIIAESNYSMRIRFVLSEFNGNSFDEIHPILIPDSFWFGR